MNLARTLLLALSLPALTSLSTACRVVDEHNGKEPAPALTQAEFKPEACEPMPRFMWLPSFKVNMSNVCPTK